MLAKSEVSERVSFAGQREIAELSHIQNQFVLYSLAAALAAVTVMLVVWLLAAAINDSLFLMIVRSAAIGAGLIVFLLVMRRYMALRDAHKRRVIQELSQHNPAFFAEFEQEITALIHHDTTA